MRVRSFEQNMALMPNGMAKKIFLKIMNTPKTDFTQMEKECDEYIARRFAEMTEEEREAYRNAK